MNSIEDYLQSKIGEIYIAKDIMKLKKQMEWNDYLINQLDWGKISKDKNLSEDFIRRYQDKVVWSFISSDQNLSDEFREEFRAKLLVDCSVNNDS